MEEFKRFLKFELFSDKNLGSVRTMEDEAGKKWFVGQDVGECLGLGSGLWKAYSNLVDEKAVEEENKKAREEKREPKMKPEDIERVRVSLKSLNLASSKVQKGRGGTRSIVLISESGMYNMIINSKSPLKNDFQRWITNDVLPSIRKHGGYIDGLEDLDKKDQSEVFEKIEVLADQVKYLKKRRRELRKQKARLQANKKKLKGTVSKLETEVSLRDRDLDDYTKIVIRQTEDYAALLKENKELRGVKPVSTVTNEENEKTEEPIIFVDKYGFRYTSSEMCLRKEER